MKTLLVTGGIGSGKTLVCRHLAQKLIPIYIADVRTRVLYDENPLIKYEIEQSLGRNFTMGDGRLDRRKLGRAIFSDPNKLEIVESIVHPIVYEDFVHWRDEREAEGAPFVVMESAIALEKPLFRSLADKVLFVDAPFEERIQRACLRDKVSKADVQNRMAMQIFDMSKVDIVLMNDKDEDTLYKKVDEIFETIWK